MFPFSEKKSGDGLLIREFDQNVRMSDLIWHRDKEDRTITIIESSNWAIQIDDQLPVVLEVGRKYYIPKNTYHRVLKGEGKLVLELKKHL